MFHCISQSNFANHVLYFFPALYKNISSYCSTMVLTFCRTIANYLMWRLLTDNFEDAMTDFVKDIVVSISVFNV